LAAVSVAGLALLLCVASATVPAGAHPAWPTAYVTNAQLSSLSVYSGNQLSGSIANVGNGPTGIAVDPTSKTAYVADYGFSGSPSSTVTPVDLSSGQPLPPIPVGVGPLAIALTPDDKFAVVTLQGTPTSPGHQVQEINLSTLAVSPAVNVGTNPQSLAISPDGHTAYVAALTSGNVTPVDLTSWPPHALAPIPLPGTAPNGIAVSPNGRTAYVLDAEHAIVIPISLPSESVGTPLDLVCQKSGDPGCTPHAIVISPNGRTAYVAAAGSADVVVLKLPSLTVSGVLSTGGYPDGLGLSGRWLYVADAASNEMSIFVGGKHPHTVGGVTYPYGVGVLPPAKAGIAAPALAQRPPPRDGAARPAGVDRPVTPFYGAP
jgi:DNA-binding beta-propeller fold protein YncE